MATNKELLDKLIALRIQSARDNLIDYALHVDETYVAEDFHLLMADAIESAINGVNPRLIISIGPRHGKSQLVSRILPSWYLGKYPGKEVIAATYGATLSESMGRDARTFCSSEQFREVFPHAKLSTTAQSKTDWEIVHEVPGQRVRASKYFSTSVGGTVTGKGAHLFIIDDVLKDRAEASSATIRQSIWDWFCSAAETRLAFADSPIIFIMTRWHEDDLCGRLLQADIDARSSGNGHLAQNWKSIVLPSLPNEPIQYGFMYEKYANKVKGNQFFREKDEPLYPVKFSKLRYEKIRQLNPSEFKALYQQEPSSEEGELFKKKSWTFKSRDEFPDHPLLKIQSWDTSATDTATADYSICTYALFDGMTLWITKRTKDRLTFPDLKKKVEANFLEFKPDLILIEYKSSGIDLVNDLAQTRLPIKAIKLNNYDSKLTRALSITPMVDNKRIILPDHEKDWTDDYLANFTKFPNGKYDDEVDSLSQLGRYVLDLTSDSFFIDDVSNFNQFPNITPPRDWPVVCSVNLPYDTTPFSVLWFCEVTTTEEIYGVRFPIGTTIVFAELYGVDKENATTGIGLSCTPEEIYGMIQEVESNFDVSSEMIYINDQTIGADPLQEDPYMQFINLGMIPIPIKLDHRVSAPYLKNRLKNKKKPLFITSNCRNLWRTLPFVQRDTTGSQVFRKDEELSLVNTLMIGLAPQIRGDTSQDLQKDYAISNEQARYDSIFSEEPNYGLDI